MVKPRPCAEVGCASIETQELCTFPADPDIAGIGVVLSFFISVTLSFLLTLYGFCFIEGSYIANQLTTLDIVITDPVNALIGKFSKDRKPLITRKVFREVILVFSDQQLITGLAILTVAFCRVKSITEYHFAVVSDLASMALVVQFSASNILGEVLGERPEMVWWRVIAFITLATLSMITFVPWGNQYYLHTYGSEMACLWNKTWGNYTGRRTTQMTIYMMLSLWGIIDVLGKYFPVIVDNRLVRGMRDRVVGCILLPRQYYVRLEQSVNPSIPTRIVRELLDALACAIFTTSELVYAEAFQLIRNWAILLVTVVDVFELRSVASTKGREGNEDIWGFGQTVPMFLLVLPLFTLVELYWDGYSCRKAAENLMLTDQQGGVELSQADGGAASTSTGVQIGSRESLSRQRLSVPVVKGVRIPSPAANHARAHTSAPGLNLEDVTNAGNYYFSYPAAKLGSTAFEDELYHEAWFRMLLRVMMTAALVICTVLACEGYAI